MTHGANNRRGRVVSIRFWLPVIAVLVVSTTANAGQVITYVHTDHLGNPVAETDSLGRVINRQHYTPYGEAYPVADPDGPGFTGHRTDADTGLVYMQARYYDPVIGRFLSVDPVTFSFGSPEHFNRYWYANGNPVGNVDPDGREPGDFAAGFAMGLVYNEEQVEKIASAEAACEVCGSDLTDGLAAGQAAGTLIENGVSIEGVALAVASIGGKKKGASGRRTDNSKSERHGDGGRAQSKAEKQIEQLQSQLDGASKKERRRIEKKIQNIREDAARKRRGEEHSRGPKK